MFWDFLMVGQISFHHEWNEAWLSVINWYILSALQVAEQLRKISGKSQNFIELLLVLSPPPEFCEY